MPTPAQLIWYRVTGWPIVTCTLGCVQPLTTLGVLRDVYVGSQKFYRDVPQAVSR